MSVERKREEDCAKYLLKKVCNKSQIFLIFLKRNPKIVYLKLKKFVDSIVISDEVTTRNPALEKSLFSKSDFTILTVLLTAWRKTTPDLLGYFVISTLCLEIFSDSA